MESKLDPSGSMDMHHVLQLVLAFQSGPPFEKQVCWFPFAAQLYSFLL